MLGVLTKLRFQLRNLYSRIHFHFDRPGRGREKLAEARQELNARREKTGNRTDRPGSRGGPGSTPLPVARPIRYTSPSP